MNSGYFISLLFLSAQLVGADPNPYDFNVYTQGNIGSQNNPYGSDFQGTTGAGGSAYFNGFSGNEVGPVYLYSVYTGGSFNIGSGQIRGGVEAAGNVNASSMTIQGNVHGGGNLTGSGGTITGNVSIQGTNTSSITINGSTSTGQNFTPSLNLPSITQYFKNASNYWAGLTPTATYTNVFGQLQVSNLVSGRNIVNLTLADLNNSYGIKLTGASDAYVVFNINDAGSSLNLKDVTFSLNGGIANTNVLYNVTNASSMNLSGGQYLSILGINTDFTFPSGLVTGNLSANNLYGSGQVNLGTFTGFQKDQDNFNVAVPEPSTYLLLGSILALLGFIKLRRTKASRT